jgi:hypothetical protein
MDASNSSACVAVKLSQPRFKVFRQVTVCEKGGQIFCKMSVKCKKLIYLPVIPSVRSHL